MQQFAFIIHPIDVRRDVGRKYPIARYLPESIIEWYMKGRDPIVAADLTGIRSTTGAEARGWLIGCPLTPRQMLTLPIDTVWDKLEQCARMALDLGAGILGLGAFTAVVGDGGLTLSRRVPEIAITTGNSYTVATAIEGAQVAGEMMGHRASEAHVAVVGATGSIGATCAELFSERSPSVTLVGRSADRLEQLAVRLRGISRGEIRVSTDVAEGLRDADIVVTVTSAVDAIILPEHIKRGAVVCDVSRPRDVSVRVARERSDVLVIEGGVVSVPGAMRCMSHTRPDSPFSFGFPPGTAYACMSETMMLALDGRYESLTLGKEVTATQVEETQRLARRHGFHLAGFRSFEKAVDEAAIERTRRAAFGDRGAPEAPAAAARLAP